MTERNQILNEITIDDIPKECRDLAAYLGLESFVDFCFMFSGENIYVPSAQYLYKHVRDRKIVYEHDMMLRKKVKPNAAKEFIAKKYGLSARQVRNILHNAVCNAELEQVFE